MKKSKVPYVNGHYWTAINYQAQKSPELRGFQDVYIFH